jgi:hypothetical protein
MTTSTLNSSSVDANSRENTQNSSSNRRRVRVKFDYSFDNDQRLPRTQTTVIKSQPCFKVTVIEDQMTKHFYQNRSKHNTSQVIPKEHQTSHPVIQRTPSEVDSLEDEYLPKSTVNYQFISFLIQLKNYLSFRKKRRNQHRLKQK